MKLFVSCIVDTDVKELLQNEILRIEHILEINENVMIWYISCKLVC
jgi:hypothetical protein